MEFSATIEEKAGFSVKASTVSTVENIKFRKGWA
jgi:hypothetical protein